MVCGCVLQSGQSGDGYWVSSTLCRYEIRMGLLLVLSWARVRRVSLGREEFRWGNQRDKLLYEFGMVAL